MPVEITIVTGARKGECIQLKSDLIRVGDDPSFEIYFNPEDDPEAEGRRATLVLEESGWRIRNTGSRLLWVNQDAVEGSVPLRSGDTVRMSDMGPDLRFKLISAHDVPTPAGTDATERLGGPDETQEAVSPAAVGEVGPRGNATTGAHATHCEPSATDEGGNKDLLDSVADVEVAQRIDRQGKRKLLFFGGSASAAAAVVFVALGVASMLSEKDEEVAMSGDDGGLPARPEGSFVDPKENEPDPEVEAEKKPAPPSSARPPSGVRKMSPEEARRRRDGLDSFAAIAKAEEAALRAKKSDADPAVDPAMDPAPAKPASPKAVPPSPKPEEPREELRSTAEMAKPPASKPPTVKPPSSIPSHLTPEQIRERLNSFAAMGREPTEKPVTNESDEKAPAVDRQADLIPVTPPPSAPESRKPVPSKDALDVADRMLHTVLEPQLEAVKRGLKTQNKINGLARLVTELKGFAEDSTRDDAVRYQAHIVAIRETAKLGQIQLAIGYTESLTRLFELDEVRQMLKALEQANFEIPGAEFREKAQHDMLLALGDVMAQVEKTKRFEENYNGLILADVLLDLHEAVQEKHSHEADDFSDALRTARENQARFRAYRIHNARAKED